MHDSDIYTKTTAGAEELKSRERRLQQRLRTMLIMIDGSRTVAQLRAAAAALGAPDDFLQSLHQQGLVALQPVAARPAPVPPPVETPTRATRSGLASTAADDVERFSVARKLMNDTAVDALGFRAFLFTLKLERCFTIQDLSALLPELQQGLVRTRGESFAVRVTDRVRALLL